MELLYNLYILELSSRLTFCTWCVLFFCYDSLRICYITFGFRELILGFFFLNKVILENFLLIVFGNTSKIKTCRFFRRHIRVHLVQISSFGLLYFQRCSLWKIGYFISPITSIKHVFMVKQSYIIHRGSKFHETKCNEKRKFLSIFCVNFIVWY
jgi:hypothetical protein